jgi:16S rRNA (guanine966-N2)-methyltransferase
LDARISKRNRKKLSLENWIIFQNDALRAVRMLGKRGVNFDVVFIDPPYSQLEKIEILRECVASDILNIESIVVIETDVKEVLPQEVGPLALAKLASYGQTKLSYYKEKC